MTSFDSRRRSTWFIWFLAAGAAMAAHASLAAAFISFEKKEIDEGGGASAIEISLETASPKMESPDLPMGLESNASDAAPDSSQSKAKTELTENSVEQLVESDHPAEIAVRTTIEQKRQPDPEANKRPTSIASRASAASEAMAALAHENALEARIAAAPDAGADRASQRARETWEKKLVAHLDRHKLYPIFHQQEDIEIPVRFEIDGQGRLKSAMIVRNNSKAAEESEFEDAALAMMKRANPFPAPPSNMVGDSLIFTIPIIFKAHRK